MSKKSPSKLVNCLICQKKTETNKHTSIISFVNYFFPELVAEIEQEEETYMVTDCPCFAVYDEEGELIGISKSFIKGHGET